MTPQGKDDLHTVQYQCTHMFASSLKAIPNYLTWKLLNCRRELTFEQSKVLSAEAVEGIVCWRKDGVGAFLLQQIGQTCSFHQ